MQSALSPWTNGRMLRSVERYTGSERRSARDRVATAFRELGPPWVLVASNVGAEGIDLHTYTARIVHYDLEWNPAKMEQREGRGDRVGRRLKDKLEILYCLVPRTYDERMFHQLVARDRWHGVLLGKPALQLEDDRIDTPLIDRKRLKRMRLDLAPRI
jgi:superfamily II DNA/RNA helicase